MVENDTSPGSQDSTPASDETLATLNALAAETAVVRVRFGSRESKRAAKRLVDHLTEQLGDVARVVLRRNHLDEESPLVIVAVEYFGVGVHLSNDSIWTGGPNSPDDDRWVAHNCTLMHLSFGALDH